MNFQPHIKRTILHAILFTVGILLSIFTHAQVQVAFSGHVIMPDTAAHTVTMTFQNGDDVTTMDLRPNDAFSFFTMVEDSATLTVTSPGFITKRISFTTSPESMLAATEQVRFNVAMEPQPVQTELCYTGPVGKIHFSGKRAGGRPALEFIPQQKVAIAPQALTAAR